MNILLLFGVAVLFVAAVAYLAYLLGKTTAKAKESIANEKVSDEQLKIAADSSHVTKSDIINELRDGEF